MAVIDTVIKSKQRVNPIIDVNPRRIALEFLENLNLDFVVPGITQWAENNRYLPEGTTDRPGMWQAKFVPYAVEIQECLHPDSAVRVLSIIKSTQSLIELFNNFSY